jgi:ankyrin repeat protein
MPTLLSYPFATSSTTSLKPLSHPSPLHLSSTTASIIGFSIPPAAPKTVESMMLFLIFLKTQRKWSCSTPFSGKGRSGLHLVASSGLHLLVEKVYEYAPETLNMKDRDSNTPLHLAALYGHLAIVKALLATEDIDVNAKGRMVRHPFIWRRGMAI